MKQRISALAVALFLSVPASAGPPPASVVVRDDAGNGVPGSLALEKGAIVTLRAQAYEKGGAVLRAPITWTSEPPGIVKITPNADGSAANVVAARDLHDDPDGFEPWANVRACAGDVCRWVFVSCVVSLSGDWTVEVDVTNSFLGLGDTTERMTFVQSGRQLQVLGLGKKPMTATINGRDLDFRDPNGKLVKFSGAVTGRNVADGTWRSNKGYEGKWHATK